MKSLTYIIYAPPYDPNSGGTIFLHELVHALNGLGQRALLWPMKPLYRAGIRAQVRRALFGPWRSPPFATSRDLHTPVAARTDLTKDAVVVYPEIVPGNPLKVRNVVRWLLYKPGIIHPYEFGESDMFFRVGEMFDLPEVTGGAPDLYLYRVNPAYRDKGLPGRTGACFMVRKGWAKPRIPETADAIQIDGKSHEDTAAIFNACEVFYSYDEATFYSQYAAICGCLSIVIPGHFAPSREEWVRQYPIARYGIAYGTHPSEIEHARSTRHLLLADLTAKETSGNETVRRFVELTQSRFGGAA